MANTRSTGQSSDGNPGNNKAAAEQGEPKSVRDAHDAQQKGK